VGLVDGSPPGAGRLTTLPRLHLFEVEDQPWCPAPVRDALTDYLQFAIEKFRPYRAIAPRLAAALTRTGARRIVDLCAGGGGPWPDLLDQMGLNGVRVRLTDRFPNRDAFARMVERSGGRVEAEPGSVDAAAVPGSLTGFRTIFSSFHHFRPAEATGILADAVRCRAGIAVFEGAERRWLALLWMVFTPLIVLVAMPSVRPARLSHLVLTYLIPLVPLVVLWDGIVSCLRCYVPEELEALARAADDGSYEWEAGHAPVPMSPLRITYLVGTPK
jgi:hypothetical protein